MDEIGGPWTSHLQRVCFGWITAWKAHILKNPLEWLTGIDADELTMLVPLYQPLTLRNVYDTWYINI